MIDIKFLRENPEVVKENIRKKFQDSKLPLVDEVIELDAESRKTQQEADDLRANRNKISKEIGALMAKRDENTFLLDEFKEQAASFVATEDGSVGTKGFVTDHPLFAGKYDMIYCCGPKPMMLAVAKSAKAREIDCEVSLENKMACGLGACLCCVEETTEGNLCTCTHGPVFNINQLTWPI